MAATVSAPEIPRAPVHAPLAVQEVTRFVLHRSVVVSFLLTVVLSAASVTVGAGRLTVSEAVALPRRPRHVTVKVVAVVIGCVAAAPLSGNVAGRPLTPTQLRALVDVQRIIVVVPVCTSSASALMFTEVARDVDVVDGERVAGAAG